MSKILQGHRTKLNKTKKNKQKRQKRRQSVEAAQTAVILCSTITTAYHCQTTTEKVQSSARDGTSSVTEHSWQTTAGCSTHVLMPLGRHDHWAFNIWWTVRPAWLCQQSADGIEYRHQMSREGPQQGTSALFHEDSGRPERTAGMWLAPELATMELTKQWGYAFWPPRWENQTGGGIQDRLQPVLQLAIANVHCLLLALRHALKQYHHWSIAWSVKLCWLLTTFQPDAASVRWRLSLVSDKHVPACRFQLMSPGAGALHGVVFMQPGVKVDDMVYRTITVMSCCSNSCCQMSVKLLATLLFSAPRVCNSTELLRQDSGIHTRRGLPTDQTCLVDDRLLTVIQE